ncbi:hypothetical protein [Herbiconiux daphne]|uniref:HNH endonuclease n=1 Tax=Herbiconiux daphne TaxID=2970914 RepID=A0ABT2HAS7_9MICO|nr:hypothetical protein [Herbiconiux daphne]MCS5737045.1 hypothetical protein [Herbiconiux daphne]
MEKPICYFENYGTITEDGKVRSYKRKGCFRKTCIDSLGQEGITINSKRVLIKHLVYTTFVGSYDAKRECIYHIDGNMNNHHFSNLAVKPIDRFKLSQKVAEEIRKERKAGAKLASLAVKYQVSKAMISKIVNGLCY